MMATEVTFDKLNDLQKQIVLAYLNALMDETTPFNIARTEVYFKGDDAEMFEWGNISLTPCDYEDSPRDKQILYYVEGLYELLNLADPDNGEDFIIVGFNGFDYISADCKNS